jgi:hypothetical protein
VLVNWEGEQIDCILVCFSWSSHVYKIRRSIKPFICQGWGFLNSIACIENVISKPKGQFVGIFKMKQDEMKIS